MSGFRPCPVVAPRLHAGYVRQDSAGLDVLSRDESLSLLASVPVGRIAFTIRALPAIQPVNFLVDGDSVVFRTGVTSSLAAAARESIVAFEADAFDEASATGWSVTIVGRCRWVEDPDELSRLAELPLQPWAPDNRDHYVRIDADLVTGRRLRARTREVTPVRAIP